MGVTQRTEERGEETGREKEKVERRPGGGGAGPGPKVAAGWSSSTNCSPAASASTGTEPQNCYHANTATASTRAWRDWWTMSRNRSNAPSVVRSTGSLTTGS